VNAPNIETRGEGIACRLVPIVKLGNAADLVPQDLQLVRVERRIVHRAGIGDASVAEVDPILDAAKQRSDPEIGLGEESVAEAGA